MLRQIDETVNFVKRHRGKFAVGATFIGAIYAAKKIVESDAFSEISKSINGRIGLLKWDGIFGNFKNNPYLSKTNLVQVKMFLIS